MSRLLQIDRTDIVSGKKVYYIFLERDSTVEVEICCKAIDQRVNMNVSSCVVTKVGEF